jgi:division protein CdvB (Snf7/Vps24/ESCRT-III family)
MGKNFMNKWQQKENDSSIVSKIKNVAMPSEGNLKQKITEVTHRLDAQTKTLDAAVLRFQNRDAEIFNRIIKATTQRESARANILATELSEIRKVEKMLSHASLGLQSVSMRLSTVSEMGDIITVLNPARNVIGSIKTEMCTIFPEASQELGSIGNLLSDICSTTSQDMDMPVNTTSSSEEAMQILQEAEFAAENKLKKTLPEIELERFTQRKTVEEALG